MTIMTNITTLQHYRYAEPIAMEGALKLKEICYIHAEGYVRHVSQVMSCHYNLCLCLELNIHITYDC